MMIQTVSFTIVLESGVVYQQSLTPITPQRFYSYLTSFIRRKRIAKKNIRQLFISVSSLGQIICEFTPSANKFAINLDKFDGTDFYFATDLAPWICHYLKIS